MKKISQLHLMFALKRLTEAATGDVLQRKVFLKNSQNSQEKHLCQSLFF